MIKEAIIKLSKKQDLAYAEAEAVMDEIMSGQATPVQMSSYLTALSLKGETIDEITASAAGMRAHCIKLLHNLDVLEIVGTGGDGSNSFNISTTSSLVIAAGGVPVAKHGNRAASSKSGAADVLEALRKIQRNCLNCIIFWNYYNIFAITCSKTCCSAADGLNSTIEKTIKNMKIREKK